MALVMAAGVMRELGITVDKVMDLVIEKEFSKGRRHYKNSRPQSFYHEK